MLDEDIITEYFEFSYTYEDDHGQTTSNITKTFNGGTSLYEENGIIDTFLTFLRGAGYNIDKVSEAMEDL